MDEPAAVPDPEPGSPPPTPRRWRNEEGEARAARRRGRTLALVSALVIASGLVAVIGWFRPLVPPAWIVVGEVAGEDDPIPHWAADRRALAGFEPGSGESVPVADGIVVIGANKHPGTLVVYVCARGWIGRAEPGSNSPTLRLSRPDGPRLDGLLAAILRHPATEKLLILDIHPPPDDPRAGVILADVAAVVAAESRRVVASGSRLAVLTSCEPGQRPLGSDASGRSAFGYYVEQGLKGAADASDDGRVTARELAAFARDRVARWTRNVRDVAQTPALFIGDDVSDIPLALAPRAIPAPAELPKDAPAYPDWLAGAWRERDALRASGAGLEAPRPLGQFESAILRAEQGWRDGLDEAPIRSDLADRLGLLRKRLGATRAIPHPVPRSLALEEALGTSPDPEALRAREALAKRPRLASDAKPGEREAADAKAIADFYDPAKFKLRSEFDLANVVFRVATEDPSPGRDSIVFLDQLLANRQERPLYVETETLRRLARLPAGAWRPETVRRVLRLARDGERAQSLLASLSGGSALLDEATRLRHEAEVLVGSPGYAIPAEVDRRLDEALAATEVVLARSSLVAEARRLTEEAASVLPPTSTLFEVLPDIERPWLAASEEARAVLELLDKGRTVSGPSPSDDLPERTEALGSSLLDIAGRVARIGRPGSVPGPAEARQIAALLAIPLPTAERRLALWKAGIEADRRLIEAMLRLDGQDGRKVRASSPSASIPGGDLIARLDSGSSARRMVSERLLDLAGDTVGPSEILTAAETLAGRWAGLVLVPEGDSAARRDRRLRLIPPWVAARSIDEPESDPTRERRSEEFTDLRRWLAARYAFEARDANGSEFFAEAAHDFEKSGDPPQVPSVRLDRGSASVLLEVRHPEAVIRFMAGGIVAPARMEVATADGEWLDLSPGLPWPEDRGVAPRPGADPIRFVLGAGPEPVEIPLRLALRPESGSRLAPIPPGLVIRARMGARTSHLLIPIRLEPESRRLQVALTADQAGKGGDLAEVRLRAARGKTPFYLTLRNPGDRDRKVNVELLDRRGPIEGASTTLAVKAGEVTRAVFGPPSGKPEEGFVEIVGTLTIRVTDPQEPGWVIVRAVPVGLASPSDYARLISARFEPAGPGNGDKSKLEIRIKADGPIEGPACPVELSLLPGRIPGLISPGEGTYHDKLAKIGDEVALTVEGIEIDGREEKPGFLDLAIDGIERAAILQARLGRGGGPTDAVPITRPAIRLRVAPSGLSTAPLPVGIELDSPPERGRVVVELGRNLADGFRVDASTEIESGRGRVRLNPRGPDGSLVFEATLRDPSVTLPVGKIRGRRLVRARLFDEQGAVLDSAEFPVVLDDRPPEAVGLVDVPKYGLKGGTLALRASGSAPDSGLQEVAFFLGRPVDGKRPAGVKAVPGRPLDPGRTTWAASLPLGDLKLGPVDVSVEFVAGVGLGRFDTAIVTVVEAIPAEPGKVRGTVAEGSRPQPAFEVFVLDEKGAEKAKTKTDNDGRFEVAGLAPGNYVVVSVKATPPTRGSAKVALKPGETAEVKVEMFRGSTGR